MENAGYLVLVNNSYVGKQTLLFDGRAIAYRHFVTWCITPGTTKATLNRVSKGGTVVDELGHYERPPQ
jgi:hypothetical protein